SEDRVRPEHQPIWITGVGTCHDNCTDHMTFETAGRVPSVYGSAARAYKMAGVTDPLRELDLIELNDLIAGLELLSYAELGLCEVGRGGELIDAGATDRDGEIPVNPSGGRIGAGHIAGVSGVYSVGEVALQLAERAGDRQVKIDQGRGLVSVTGGAGLTLSAAVVLERG